MTNPKYTHATLVVDRSGSMYATQEDAQGGINAFLEEQKAQSGKMTLSLFDFDDVVTVRHRLTPIAEVPRYTLIPRGGTALLDAVGVAISDTGVLLADLEEADRPGTVIVAIVTDGEENRSQEWTLAQVKELIERQQSQCKWTFVFLGAGTSSWAGQAMGVQHTSSYAGTGAGTRAAYGTMSAAVTKTRGGAAFSMPGTI